MTRTLGRLGAALALGLSAVTLSATAASAHVSVSTTDATRGGFGLATFRVPNESDTASTTKVTVQLPQDTPFAFVSAEAVPGWKATRTTEKLDEPVKTGDYEVTDVVTSITWTATDGGIAPGEFGTFGLSGGPFPDADELMLPATQTYSDGEVVAWDQEQTGDDEPEKPAPVLALAAGGEGDHHGGGDDAEASETETEAASTESSSTGTVLGGIALVVSAAALALTIRQTRRRA